MSPLLQAALGSLVRSLLMVGAGWLVERGVWTQGEAGTYMTALAMFLVSFGWSVWVHYRSRIKFLTALDSPAGTTEQRVTEKIATGLGATLAG